VEQEARILTRQRMPLLNGIRKSIPDLDIVEVTELGAIQRMA
jgi:hypothetical protein